LPIQQVLGGAGALNVAMPSYQVLKGQSGLDVLVDLDMGCTSGMLAVL